MSSTAAPTRPSRGGKGRNTWILGLVASGSPPSRTTPQRHRQPGLVDDGQQPLMRPEDQGCAAVGALERRPFIAGRFMEMLLVRIEIIERRRRREFLFFNRDH